MSDKQRTDLFSEREKIDMLENWFEQRTDMTSKAFKFILFPSIPVPLFALLFWFQNYIPIPPVIWLVLFGLAILFWFVFIILAVKKLKRVRTGDAIMLKKIRSSREDSDS